MSPWRIMFDAIGWAILVMVLAVCLFALLVMVTEYARELWDARGEPPREGDYTSTTNDPRAVPRDRGGET